MRRALFDEGTIRFEMPILFSLFYAEADSDGVLVSTALCRGLVTQEINSGILALS